MSIVLSFSTMAYATNEEHQTAANSLYDLGLFNGTGTDSNGNPIFELERVTTRHEAITMLVRLLGKDAEAKALTWNIPFTDVVEWAKPYVGYAYANGLTSGTSNTTYGGNDTVSATQYLTFILRALGYDDKSDFQWDKAWILTDTLGITDGRYNQGSTEITRGDVVYISKNALSALQKDSEQTLIEKLVNGNVVSSEAAMNSGLVKPCTTKLSTLPAQVTHTVIQKDGSINKAVVTVNNIERIMTPRYNYDGILTGYKLELKINYTFNSSDFKYNDFSSLYFVLYDGDKEIKHKDCRLEGIQVGKTYTATYDPWITLEPGNYSLLLRNGVYDSRTGESTYYDIP